MRRLRRLSGIQRVWALSAVLAPLTALVSWRAFEMAPTAPPFAMPSRWVTALVFLAAVYVGEIAVVHIRFRRDAHSFSMSELPVVAGLSLLSGGTILVLGLVANLAALTINRRQQPVKLVFNLLQLTMQTATMITVFHLVVGAGDPIGPRAWLGALAAIAAAGLFSNLAITAAILLAGGTLGSEDRRTMFVLTFTTSLMNGTLGLVAATILWTRPGNAWMTLVGPGLLYLAYRAYLSQRVEADRLRALYDVTGELHRLPQIGDAMVAATEHARTMLDVESASILLLPDGISGPVLLTTTSADGELRVMEVIPEVPVGLAAVAETGEAQLLPANRARAERLGIGVTIPDGDGGAAGILSVRGPLSAIGSFGEAEVRLLETLAQHVGVSLENGRLEDSVARLSDLKERLRHQATHDGLTGIANRTLFMERLSIACGSDTPGAVLFLDLDDFKSVNDGYGHDVGDSLLVSVARRLEACSRPDDVVARLGGDEFAILLPRLRAHEDAAAVAERIVESLARPFKINDVVLRAQASIGVAMIDGTAVADTVLREADAAMYTAKYETKGSFRVHSPVRGHDLDSESAQVRALLTAIDEDQLVLHYQPVIDLHTANIVGLEALVRWHHPEAGFIGPDRFVPLAERNGLSARLAQWVIESGTRTVRDWRNGATGAVPWLSVNLSAADVGDPTLARTILDILQRTRFAPERLVIEITESSILDGGRTMLDEVRAAGASVALDDFGTGYSSLATLDQIPVDVLKLDRSFLDHLHDPRKTKLLEIILGAGTTMGFTTVAEGIETYDQLDVVFDLGATFGQGYLLCRPQPADIIHETLIRGTIPAIAGRHSPLSLVGG